MLDLRRTDIGFQGGQELSVRAGTEAYDGLLVALSDDRTSRWHLFETEDSQISIDLAQVVYVKRESGDQKVGF